MEKPDLYLTSDHDEAADVGGIVLLTATIALIVAAIAALVL